MRVQDHIKLSTTAAIVTLPWLKQDVWIPFAASIFIDVDHYIWHAATQRTLSLQAAIKYFGQAAPPQGSMAKFLHHPLVLGPLMLLATVTRSRLLWLILAGLLFHVSLDAIHLSQLHRLKHTLSEQTGNTCSQCGQQFDTLQLHTIRVTRNMLDRYNSQHFTVLCPTCHEEVHKPSRRTTQTMV